jgi:choline dehydrogenase-like flavoprotein
VLVLEFGIADRSNTTLWPVNAQALNIGAMFNITSAPEPHMGGGRYSIRAGSIAGGGSSVNGMELDRASAADYDSFAQLENGKWDWKNLLGYFKKVRWSSYGASSCSREQSTHFNVPNPEIAQKYKYTWDTSAYGNGPLQAAYPEFQYPDNCELHHSETRSELNSLC